LVDVRERLRRVVELLMENSMNILLLQSPSNVFYFTGFRGEGALLVTSEGVAKLFVTRTYYKEATDRCGGFVDIIMVGPRTTLYKEMSGSFTGFRGVLGYDSISAENYLELVSIAPSMRIVNGSDIVWRLRQVKDDEEVRLISDSCRIVSSSVDLVRETLSAGMTIGEVKSVLAREMFRLGAQSFAFPPVVSAGVSTARPYGDESSLTVRNSDLVMIRAGAVVGGYCSDIARTYFVGREASETVSRLHELMMEAKEAGEKAAEVWATGFSVDAAARTVAEKSGHSDTFVESLGNGIGLDPTEPPLLSPTSRGFISENTVITISPGVFLPGQLGFRVGDTYVVHRTGVVRLTDASTELEVY